MITDKEHKRHLKQFHKFSDRHILAVETDMPYSDVLKVVALSDKIRKAGNELVGLMRKNYDQLMRTKRYRKLLFLYGNTKDKDSPCCASFFIRMACERDGAFWEASIASKKSRRARSSSVAREYCCFRSW